MIRQLLARIRYRRFDRDLREELELHRALLTRDDADGAARAMGNELRMRELARDVWVRPSLDAWLQDLRDALRFATRRPAFTATVAGVLGLGVTVSVVAFSLLDALLLRPLPVDRPERLVYLRDPSFSYPIVREVQQRTTVFTSSFAWNLSQYDVDWGAGLQPALVMLASSEMYRTLGVGPQIGRLLAAHDDDATESAAVGVLSDRTWRTQLGADAAVIGRTVRIGDAMVTIVGVTPPGFFGVSPGRAPDITVPVLRAPRLRQSDRRMVIEPFAASFHVMARLADGVALEQADAAFQVAWRQALEAVTPASLPPQRRERFLGRRTGLVSAATGFSSVRNQFRQPLIVLAWFGGLLLVVTCATVTNMLVAGTWGRSREVAVRVAIGCGRMRLARQLLIEGLLLATGASVLALAIAPFLTRWLVSLVATSDAAVTVGWTVDARLLAAVTLLVVMCAAAFSIAPIVLALHVDTSTALRGGARQPAAHGGALGRSLVAVQIAVSVVLLIGAGLFTRSLARVLSVDPGFESRNLYSARIAVTVDPRAAIDALQEERGVEAAAVSLYPPISDRDGSWTQSIAIDGAAPLESSRFTFFNAVSPGFVSALRIPLVAGRDFSWADAAGNARVAIVNAAFARRFFADENPIGHRVSVGLDASRRDLTIVGIAADTRYQRLQEERREIVYVPLAQAAESVGARELFATIRARRAAIDDAESLRQRIAALNPDRAVRLEAVSDRIRQSLVTERALSSVALSLAACALVLSCAGVFGVMSHLVSRRMQEIGIRMALGARAAQVLRQMLGQTMAIAAGGVAIGSAVAFASVRRIEGLLHVSSSDAITYAAAAGTTLVLAAVAGWIPARRAAAIAPTTALRAD
jgi:putative ABC transport system permease protein